MQQALEIQGCKTDIAPYILVGNIDHKKNHIITSLTGKIQAQGGQERPTTRCWLSQKEARRQPEGKEELPFKGSCVHRDPGQQELVGSQGPPTQMERQAVAPQAQARTSDSKPVAAKVSVM